MASGRSFAIAIILATAFCLNHIACAEEADATGLEGKDAPDISLKTLDGKDFKLSDLKGEVVVLDFWATWCPPCRKSLPHIQEISQDKDLAAKGLKVFAINAKEEPETVKKFLEENKYTFAVPMDAEGKTMDTYKVSGIPTTVIVGADGKVAKVFVGFGEGAAKSIDEAINDALAKVKPAA
jgi:thiol-disulfide isomerase/thioredoxin